MRRWIEDSTGRGILLHARHALGGVAERLNATVLKTVGPQGLVGSNPTPSATRLDTTRRAILRPVRPYRPSASATASRALSYVAAAVGYTGNVGLPFTTTVFGGPIIRFNSGATAASPDFPSSSFKYS